MVYVLMKLSYRWVLLDRRDCEVAEFYDDEVKLLNRFVNVVGCEGTFIRLGILEYTGDGGSYEVGSWLGNTLLDYFMSRLDLEELKKRGYLLEEHKVSQLCYDYLFSPKLAVAYGIKALVTDKGMLIYLNTMCRPRVILGEFCSSIASGAIVGYNFETTYVMDDRVKEVAQDFMGNSWRRIMVDITNLTNSSVMMALSIAEKLQEVYLKSGV